VTALLAQSLQPQQGPCALQGRAVTVVRRSAAPCSDRGWARPLTTARHVDGRAPGVGRRVGMGLLLAIRSARGFQPRRQLEQLRAAHGLNDPILVRLEISFADLVRGDFGYSFRYREPAFTMVRQRLGAVMNAYGIPPGGS
jgi:hypothetical protein